MSIFKSDADRIRWQLRCKLGEIVDALGQESVAHTVGTKQPNVSRVMNAENKPSIGLLVRWLKSLGVDVNFTVTKY